MALKLFPSGEDDDWGWKNSVVEAEGEILSSQSSGSISSLVYSLWLIMILLNSFSGMTRFGTAVALTPQPY